MVKSRWQAAKLSVVEAAQEMSRLGLVVGTAGNVSRRLENDAGAGLIAITPSGMPYSRLTPDDIVVVDFDIEPVEGDGMPSSESLLHAAIFRARPDIGAVVHTHSVYASVAAVAGLHVPPIIDEMTIRIGGAIEVSEYAFPGSQELADSVCRALGERKAALIRNHGAVGVGRDLEEALEVSALVERVAHVFAFASLLGRAAPLPANVIETELALYRMRQATAMG